MLLQVLYRFPVEKEQRSEHKLLQVQAAAIRSDVPEVQAVRTMRLVIVLFRDTRLRH